MLTIRLARTGRKKYPTYRIVAAEAARATTGKFVSVLGHYNPHTKELVIKTEETLKYIGNGAQPSNAVIKLLQREKVKLPDWVTLATKTKAPKKAAVAKAEAPASETSTETAEAAEPTAEPTVGATAAVDQAEKVAADAPADADPDLEITATAASEAAATDQAEQADDVAAEAAIDTKSDDTPAAE